jgi:hypothetical protein
MDQGLPADDPAAAERASIAQWLRDQATEKRNSAATYINDKAVARHLNNAAAELGRLANCIERGDHHGKKRRLRHATAS